MILAIYQEAVIDSYINLLKRGYFPSKYTIKKYKNEKSKRNTLSKNGITITGNNGIEVTYYNKYRQLKEKNPKCRYIDNSRKSDILQRNSNVLLHLPF